MSHFLDSWRWHPNDIGAILCRWDQALERNGTPTLPGGLFIVEKVPLEPSRSMEGLPNAFTDKCMRLWAAVLSVDLMANVLQLLDKGDAHAGKGGS